MLVLWSEQKGKKAIAEVCKQGGNAGGRIGGDNG